MLVFIISAVLILAGALAETYVLVFAGVFILSGALFDAWEGKRHDALPPNPREDG